VARPNAKTMRALVGKGQAMPAPGQSRPGRFNIANRSDLDKAIRAVGRVTPDTDEARAKVRRFIIKRARALNAADAIPPTWNADGSLKPST
jgi:hypothetical protein